MGLEWDPALTVPCLILDTLAASELYHQLYHLTKARQAWWIRAGLGGGWILEGGFENLKAFYWVSKS